MISILSTTASTIQSACLTTSKSSEIFPTLILLILVLSISNGGLDLKILSLAFVEISVVKSKRVTGTFALHKCAAIPLPIVPDPITTTFLISINVKIYYRLIPLSLSDLLLKSSAVTKINVERIIKQVATAKIVGLNCSLKPVHI